MNSATGTGPNAPGAPHALDLWADDQKVATLGCESLNDRWPLDCDADWVAKPGAFPLSPALPFQPPADGYAVGAVKRFGENLLPEGRALDIAATTYRDSKSNVFALIGALGTETTGAFRFLRSDEVPPVIAAKPLREVTREELDRRLAERDQLPPAVWDGKVRMSIAGVQDKLMVYLDRPLDDGGRLFRVEPPLASTHILKPDPARRVTPHRVVNEHFCMSLARRMKLPVAEVGIYRTPKPVLVVRRFDRVVVQGVEESAADGPNDPTVQRLHIIDACQASDLPESYKYERNLGSGEHLGAAVERLRGKVEYTSLPAFLLAEPFTLPQLQRVCEIVLGRPVDKSGFRTRMLSARFLEETGYAEGPSNRPAKGYGLKDRQSAAVCPRTFSPRGTP